ncbi:MAG: hypothetical protein DWQ31_17090 [Planctomycetota bacterium]|nr:MAG: hypothetical protein DWQ31_17090 [Planctomycetota bacterium]REJ92070.1 MAG: hypothetical protein DWQ35_13040 [Planctomycetota bacterium]REK28606.1 MAG: hypothetical protein DWQ42_04630 [Planctomycetota bacterium]
MNEIRFGDLVVTSDGYFGIVVAVETRDVFLGNGMRAVLSRKEWSALRQLPITSSHEDNGAAANFAELLEQHEQIDSLRNRR